MSKNKDASTTLISDDEREKLRRDLTDDFYNSDARKFAEKHFSSEIKDLTLMVLKGHLVIESLLSESLKSRCFSFKSLEKAGLNFYQMIRVHQAFDLVLYETKDDDSSNKDNKDFYDALIILNKLRNALAHDLESTKVDALVDQLAISTRINRESSDQLKSVYLSVLNLVAHIYFNMNFFKIKDKLFNR